MRPRPEIPLLSRAGPGSWGAAPGPACEGRASHEDPEADRELRRGCGRRVLKTSGRDPASRGHDPWGQRHSGALVLVLVLEGLLHRPAAPGEAGVSVPSRN